MAAICTYSVLPESLEALARALAGQIGFPGRLPVGVRGVEPNLSSRTGRSAAASTATRPADARAMTLLDEIVEQPEVAARFLRTQMGAIEAVAADIAARSEPIRHVVIAARGTSDHAAIYAQYVLGVRHGLTVALGTPSVVSLYGADPDLRDSLVIGISQSGASPDIVAVVAAARAQGAPTVAITNEPNSELAQAAARTIALVAGPELAVAATKTYTSELLAVACLSVALSGDPVDTAAVAAIPDSPRARARRTKRRSNGSPRTRRPPPERS